MGAAERADADRLEAAALVDSLSDDELARRLDAAAWLAGTELYLDRHVEADTHASRALAWNLFNRSVYALAVGDLDTALATAEQSVDLTEGLGVGFHSAWAAVRLAVPCSRQETRRELQVARLVVGRKTNPEIAAATIALAGRSFRTPPRPQGEPTPAVPERL